MKTECEHPSVGPSGWCAICELYVRPLEGPSERHILKCEAREHWRTLGETGVSAPESGSFIEGWIEGAMKERARVQIDRDNQSQKNERKPKSFF